MNINDMNMLTMYRVVQKSDTPVLILG